MHILRGGLTERNESPRVLFAREKNAVKVVIVSAKGTEDRGFESLRN
jgi:hypothetical protein